MITAQKILVYLLGLPRPWFSFSMLRTNHMTTPCNPLRTWSLERFKSILALPLRYLSTRYVILYLDNYCSNQRRLTANSFYRTMPNSTAVATFSIKSRTNWRTLVSAPMQFTLLFIWPAFTITPFLMPCPELFNVSLSSTVPWKIFSTC